MKENMLKNVLKLKHIPTITLENPKK